MVRHVIRQVVKTGHYKDFMNASKVRNDAGLKFGIPAYRVYASTWGTFNEVFTEAEYESSAGLEALLTAAEDDADFREAFAGVVSLLVDGETRDNLLTEQSLG